MVFEGLFAATRARRSVPFQCLFLSRLRPSKISSHPPAPSNTILGFTPSHPPRPSKLYFSPLPPTSFQRGIKSPVSIAIIRPQVAGFRRASVQINALKKAIRSFSEGWRSLFVPEFHAQGNTWMGSRWPLTLFTSPRLRGMK